MRDDATETVTIGAGEAGQDAGMPRIIGICRRVPAAHAFLLAVELQCIPKGGDAQDAQHYRGRASDS